MSHFLRRVEPPAAAISLCGAQLHDELPGLGFHDMDVLWHGWAALAELPCMAEVVIRNRLEAICTLGSSRPDASACLVLGMSTPLWTVAI